MAKKYLVIGKIFGSNKAFIFLPIVILSYVLINFVFSSSSASAISSVSPDYNSSSVNGTPRQPWFAVGTGHFNGQTSYAKIYVPDGNAASITIEQGCGIEVGSPSVMYTVYTLNADESFQGNPVDSVSQGAACTGNLTGITIPAGAGNVSSVKGHEGYRVLYFEAVITPSAGDNERSFRVHVSGAGSPLVGITRPIRNGGAQSGVFGVYQRDAPALGSQMWNYNQPFAQSCGDADRDYGVYVYDADYSQYSPQNLSMVMARSARTTNSWTGFKSWNSSATLGENGDSRALSFTAAQVNKYRMQWSGINFHNTLQVSVPFDEIDANIPPPNCTAPTISASCSVTNVSPVAVGANSAFTVRVTNTGSATWDSSFTLKQTYSSNFDPTLQTVSRNLTGGVIAGNPYTGPGYLAPGRSGNFSFNVSRSVPGTYYFNFTMQKNSTLIPTGCIGTLVVNPAVTSRPACYVRINGGGTNQPITLPSGGGTVTVSAQIINDSPKDWTNRYFMRETTNGGSPQNLGYLNFVSHNDGPPDNYTRQFDVVKNVTTTTQFEYEVWVVPPPAVLVGPPGINPTAGPVNHSGNDAAPIRVICPITVYVSEPPSYSPAGTVTTFDCKNIYLTTWWDPNNGGRVDPIPVQIVISSSAGTFTGNYVSTPNVQMRADPFTDPGFTAMPLHLNSYTLQAYAAGVPIGTKTLNRIPNGCLSPVSCNTPGGDVEYIPSNPYSVSFSINNETNKSDNRYRLAIVTSPPGGSRSPIGPGSNPVSGTFSPDVTTDVQATLQFNGSSAGMPSATCHITVSRYPYIKAYGGSVISGGSFKPNCTVNQGGIFGRMRDVARQSSTDQGGSGTQLIALASRINGFASGDIGGGNPNPSPTNYLSAGAQAPSSSGIFASQILANGHNTSAYCLPDYWSMQYPIGDPRIREMTSDYHIRGTEPANSQYLYKRTSFGNDIEIATTASAFTNISGKRTYFIDGDLHIESNVSYLNSGSYPSIAAIPNITIIVRGNIYIKSSVSRLDGIYIAQPDSSGNGGTIYTCSEEDGGGWTLPDQVYRECRSGYGDGNTSSQLVFNGAVIARDIVLNRAVNTLVNSRRIEPSASTNASEVFNFSPELYLSSPILNTSSSGNSFNSLGILPPTL